MVVLYYYHEIILNLLSDVVARGGAYFGAGNGSIFLDSVVCTGTEDRLTDCPASTEHTCGHSQDAGVQCGGETYVHSTVVKYDCGRSLCETIVTQLS